MKVYVRGSITPIDLDPNDFKAGGEAKAWIQGNTVFKVYHSPHNMIAEQKLVELQRINIPNVMKPKDVILDVKKKPIGFTMDLARGHSLVKLFTTGFQNDNGITPTHLVELVEAKKVVVNNIHDTGCLIVDLNEYNVIVDSSWVVPYFIDINSWQTPSYPATAISPNVRDWTCNKFTELTDWFSFAILTCYLFTGIHPFRGRHKDFKKGDLEGRMKSHVSIFNSDVRLPGSVRDFSMIPPHYKEWYIDLFEKGKRSKPPLLPGTITMALVEITMIQSTNNFQITRVKEYDSKIVAHRHVFGKSIVKTQSEVWIDNVNYKVNPGVDVIITNTNLTDILVKVQNGNLHLKILDQSIKLMYQVMRATGMMVVGNSLFITYGGSLTEIGFNDMVGKVMISIDSSWSIMPTTHEVFDGVIYQQIMGKPYLVIPIPKQGEKTKYIEKEISELAEYKVVNAKFDNGVVMLTGYKDSRYDLHIIRFGNDYKDYQHRLVEDVDLQEPNFVVLDNGIGIAIMSDDTLELFRSNPTRPEVDKFDDPEINATMRLCKGPQGVRFFQGKTVYKMVKK